MWSIDWMVLVLLVPIIGINFVFWGLVGCLRWLDGRWQLRRGRVRSLAADSLGRGEVGVLMAAHDEELVIGDALEALLRLLPPEQVHIVSDGSTDRTAQLARAVGVQVVETPANMGKANALAYALASFDLCRAYRAVTIVDADTRLDPSYFDRVLPHFDDSTVSAVAGCAHTRWGGPLGPVGRVVVAHRARVYLLTQILWKYGQTWRGLSATHIIPGFASTYRSCALAQLEVNVPGLVIEDFHMTFELNAKRLGRVVFSPHVRAYTQDPSVLGDYCRQVARWSLGLWQTVRLHVLGRRGHGLGGRPVFTASLALVLLETVVSSIVLLLLPLVIVLLAMVALWPELALVPVLGPLSNLLTLAQVLVLVFVADYLLTCFAALVLRRPLLLAAGFFFLPLRMLDAYIGLASIGRAWRTHSTGQWVSPPRRALTGEAPTPGLALTAGVESLEPDSPRTREFS